MHYIRFEVLFFNMKQRSIFHVINGLQKFRVLRRKQVLYRSHAGRSSLYTSVSETPSFRQRRKGCNVGCAVRALGVKTPPAGSVRNVPPVQNVAS